MPGSKADLGPSFGPDLTGAEVRYLMAKEWARFPDDILWRRSKLGLTMGPADRERLAAFMATRLKGRLSSPSQRCGRSGLQRLACGCHGAGPTA